MSKILLILPPTDRIKYNLSGVYPLPPLGIASISAYLEKIGMHVKIFDMVAMDVDIRMLKEHIENEKYEYYGLSCNIFNLKIGKEIIDLIKNIDKKAKTVLGGRCDSFSSEILLNFFKNLDFLLRGYAEKSMAALITSDEDKYSEISGLSYRSNGKILNNPIKEDFEFDELPFPNYDFLPKDKYRLHPPFGIFLPATIMETARGCTYQCNFCGINSSIRFRSIDSIIEQIKFLKKRFQIREIHFIDPTFTLNEERIFEFCEKIACQKILLKWSCKTRVDRVNKRLLTEMGKAGCYMISYGVESGSQERLTQMKKDLSVKQTLQAFADTHNAGIRTIAYIFLGMPGEEGIEWREALRFIEKIQPDYMLCGKLMPDTAAPLTREYMDKNDISEEEIFNAYLNGYKALDAIMGKLFNQDSAHLELAVKKIFKNFYLNPAYMYRRIKRFKNIQDIKNHFDAAWRVIKESSEKR